MPNFCVKKRGDAGQTCSIPILKVEGSKWLSSSDLKKTFKGRSALHSQTIQALAEKLEASIDTARQLRKTDPSVRYPYHPKKFQTVIWKASAIHLLDHGQLLLSNGKNKDSLVLPRLSEYLDSDIRQAELTWRVDHYELCLTIDTGFVNPPAKQEGQVAGVDLGEVNIAAVVTKTGIFLSGQWASIAFSQTTSQQTPCRIDIVALTL